MAEAVEETSLVPKAQTDIMKPDAQAGKLSRLAAFTPVNLTEAIALSKLIANSELAPKDFKGKPANVLIAMQMGAEVGLAPMASLQNIAVINGRPSLWGDAALGIVQVHPKFDGIKEEIKGDGDARTAYCTVKRKGEEAHTTTFTVAQAKKAQLWGKAGPWQTYPDRMLQMRARGFAIRDKFADALRGLILAEEAMDIPVDTSEAKKQREVATLDSATFSQLTPSEEQNRGHENTGLTKDQPKKQEDVMCGKCGKINGHEDDCEDGKKAAQDAKTSKPTQKGVFMILDIVHRETKKKVPYLILEVVDPANTQGKLYVWHQSMFEFLEPAKGQSLICEVSQGKQGDKTFAQCEHIMELAGIPFVDGKPAQQGEMPAESKEDDF